jgi:predicted TPR repeat methyltransferase
MCSYRESHKQAGFGRHYEKDIYAPGSADASLWTLEKERLADVCDRHLAGSARYLDFACGTGRILAALADRFDSAEGVDISDEMLAAAREKGAPARLVLGDLTREPNLVGTDYDLITAFRFFSNAEAELREAAMAVLAAKLASDGMLIFNIHNIKPSFRALKTGVTRTLGLGGAISHRRQDILQLVVSNGLELVEMVELGITPKFAHRIIGQRSWRYLEQRFERSVLLRKFASDVIFVCRRKRP